MVAIRARLAQKTLEAPANSLEVIKEIADELEENRVDSVDTDLVLDHELTFISKTVKELDEHRRITDVARIRRSLIEVAAAVVSAVDAIDLQESEL